MRAHSQKILVISHQGHATTGCGTQHPEVSSLIASDALTIFFTGIAVVGTLNAGPGDIVGVLSLKAEGVAISVRSLVIASRAQGANSV